MSPGNEHDDDTPDRSRGGASNNRGAASDQARNAPSVPPRDGTDAPLGRGPNAAGTDGAPAPSTSGSSGRAPAGTPSPSTDRTPDENPGTGEKPAPDASRTPDRAPDETPGAGGASGRTPDRAPAPDRAPSAPGGDGTDQPDVRRKAPDMSRPRSSRPDQPSGSGDRPSGSGNRPSGSGGRSSAHDAPSPSGRTPRAVAPWVRTRLRTAPRAAAALALLVLVTTYLAAALPRAVDRYETEGLRHGIASAAPRDSVLELTSPLPVATPSQYAEVLSPDALRKRSDELRALLPDPIRTDPAQTAHGVRTVARLEGLDPWLPRPDGISPQFVLSSPSGLDRHATLRQGRPAAGGPLRPEAVVTAKTAEALRLKPGAVVHVPSRNGERVAVTVTGIVEPHGPDAPYWAVEPLLRAPVLAPLVDEEVKYFWQAALLLSPDSAASLLATAGEPEVFFRYAPTADHLTARDTDRLSATLHSIGGGPDLVKLTRAVGGNVTVTTGLDEIVDAYRSMRDAIDPVVAVAVFGIGAVAAVVLAMTGGLFVAHRDAELALLRSRGASLTGIGLRLLGETSAVAVPAAALALGLAVATVRPPGGGSGAAGAAGGPGAPEAAGAADGAGAVGVLGGIPLGPSLLAASAVALVAMLVLPLRAVVLHRRPRLHGGRDDLLTARPSRRRTVLELTLLVLAVGAVVSLRLRGTGDSGDHLVSAAPVLVGLIAAMVLVRIYPLPLRWLGRPARRLRGAVGPLALARAGRSSSTGMLPLLALVLALTTAAFGGSVLAGVADARDRAALLSTGGDARIDGSVEWTPLPAGLTETVRGTAGVRDLAAVQIEYGVALPSHEGTIARPMSAPLVGVEPASYTRLAERTGFGPFPAELLASTGKGGEAATADTGRVLPAIASPSVAERLGREPLEVVAAAGTFRVKVVGVRAATPAVRGEDFLLVNGADLTRRAATALLVTGPVDGTALRSAVTARTDAFRVTLRSEERAGYVDSPLQTGAERIYLGAIGAGAGYAVVAVLLSLAQNAPERGALLARLRTMGLTRRQGRRLLGLEALPQAVLAALGGVLVGWAAVPLLAPGVDLYRLALATAPGLARIDGAPLRADPWSLLVPALAVVLLTALAAAGQAWWAGRRGSIKELRAGDAR
ncbi:membrane protein [Streptomyces cinereoruber]|uniref:Membrane protein n=2 Tax=Streptomyces cinereoruber TaxID=67260 RepID=A0AAV4KMY2_9ACTN|nr:membrane protein [Streptomyces cinereoruber]